MFLKFIENKPTKFEDVVIKYDVKQQPKHLVLNEELTNSYIKSFEKDIYKPSKKPAVYEICIKTKDERCRILPKNSGLLKGISKVLTVKLENDLTTGKLPSYVSSKETGDPVWYSNSENLALVYAHLHNGVVNAYKTQKDIKLLDLMNLKTIEYIYNIMETNNFPEDLKTYFRYKFDYKISIKEMINKRIEFKRYKEKEIWVNLDYSAKPGLYESKIYRPETVNISSGIGSVDLKLFKLLSPFLRKDGFNGLISPQQYSVFSNNGISIEELIIFLDKDLLKRDIKNKIDVYNWNGVELFDDYLYDDSFSSKNQNFQVYNFYLNLKREYNEIFRKKSFKKQDIYIQNLHIFNSINLFETHYDCVKLFDDTVKILNPNIICITEFRNVKDLFNNTYINQNYNMKFYGYLHLSKNNNSTGIALFYKKNILLKNIRCIKINNKTNRIALTFEYKNKKYCLTHLEIGVRINIRDSHIGYLREISNIKNRYFELKFITNKLNPDYIIGDLNFKTTDPEYMYLMEKDYKDAINNNSISSTTPFKNTRVDYILCKSNLECDYKIKKVPFYMSDHYGLSVQKI